MYIGISLALILALALAATGISTRYQADVSNRPMAVPGQNLNHNETLVRDTTLIQRADDWSLWLSGEQAFAPASLLIQSSFYRAGAGCSPWVCGANHNETLVRDTTMIQRTDDWSLWLSDEQVLAPVSLLVQFSFYRPIACPPIMCNHNETLVRDTPPSQQSDTRNFLMSGEQSFDAASLLVQFSFYRPGAVCPPWLCNHNETLVRDAAPIK